MTEFNINALTPEQVEAIKVAGGFSGSFQEGISLGQESSALTPQVSVPIDGYGHNLRPRVGPNNPQEGLVNRINIDKYNKADAERKLAAIEAQEALERERELLQEVTDPRKLQASLQALSRKVGRLEKQLKDAQATIAKLV